jgi:hypothetical protein
MAHTIQIQVPAPQTATNLEDVMYLVGRIVRWWSMTEFTVDSSIRDLLNRPDTRTVDTALIMSFKQRTQLLTDLLGEVVRDPGALAALRAIINRVRGLQTYRDFVVHGMMVRCARRPTTHIYLSRVRWSYPTQVRKTFIRKDKLLDIERKIARVNMELFMATAGCHMPTWQPSVDIMCPQD